MSLVTHSLRHLIKSPIPGGKTPVEYFRTKKIIADGLTKENLESIQFLCARYIPRCFELTSGLKLLDYIEGSFIDVNDVTFLVEILFLIQRYDLINVLPGIPSQSDFEKSWAGLCILKDQRYRNFVIQLQTQLAENDWNLFKSCCKGLANCPSLDRAGTVVDVIQKLEELNLIRDDDFSMLVEILKELKAKGPYHELQKIWGTGMKNGNIVHVRKLAFTSEAQIETLSLSQETLNTQNERLGQKSTSLQLTEYSMQEMAQSLSECTTTSGNVSGQNMEFEKFTSTQSVGVEEFDNQGVLDQFGVKSQPDSGNSQVKHCLEKIIGNEGASNTGPVAEFESYTTLAVIINNKDYYQFGCVEYAYRNSHGMLLPGIIHKNRHWSDIDVDGMSGTLKRLGVDVCVYDNLSSTSIVDCLKEIAQGSVKRGKHQNLAKYDRFLLFILSHGDVGHIYGVDGFKVLLSEVLEIFCADNCPILANKPKVVFPISCRNGTLSQETYIKYLELSKRVLEETNFLVIYPTKYGYPSHSFDGMGTAFVYEFLKVLKKYIEEKDLRGIMEVVCNRLKDAEHSQHPECSGNLTEKFYFKLTDGCDFDDVAPDDTENGSIVRKPQGE